MATLDEPDDTVTEHDDGRAAPSGEWNRPMLMAGLGLLLMLGGYAAMNYVPDHPLTSEQARQESLHADLRKWASQQSGDGASSDALAERLNRVAPPWRNPPYEIPGRLAVYGGLFLFVAAGVMMYRRPPAPKKETGDTE